MRSRVLSSGVLVATLAIGPASGGPAQAQAPGEEAPIRLKAGTFLPSRGEPAVPRSLRHRAVGAGQRTTWLVQLAGPIEPEWKAAVGATGARLLDYVPDFAFKVRMTPAQARVVRRL